MENQLQCRVLRSEDEVAVTGFVNSLGGEENEGEPNFMLWTSSFREESLKHYLSLNWCFGCFDDERLVGVVLLQPLLFWQGLTQVLWLEDIEAAKSEVQQKLLDLSYRTAREKHLQALVFSSETSSKIKDSSSGLGLSCETGRDTVVVKTAKWS